MPELRKSLHPIVAQLAPSQEQIPIILDRGRDVVATAGAGTGKTRTLVARYLSLLADGLALRSIVAITFTKKAAREMRNRVREEVRRYQLEPDLEQQERALWRQVFSDLDAARIGTIHSLCTEILRAHPAEAAIDPRFEVLDEGQTALLQAQAVDQALAWAADDREALSLFSLLGERNLRQELARLLRERLTVAESFRQDKDFLVHWEQSLGETQEAQLSNLKASPCWQDTLAVLKANQASKLDDRMESQRQNALAAVRDASGSLEERLGSLAQLGQIDLRGGRQSAWPGGKTQLAEVKKALKTVRELWRENAGLLALHLNHMDEELARALPALRATWTIADRYYETLKRKRNALDFDDLEQQARLLLISHADVLQRWRDEIEAILVDEFQDTNGSQRDLVQLLNGDRGRLFIVGDAKQSIYRFRGADVTVFRSEREEIERRGQAYSLHRSYRAHKALIQGLNDLLRPVLGKEQDPSRPWAEPFAPLSHHREASHPSLEAPFIELHLTVGSKGGGALDRAADALVNRIVELVERSERPGLDAPLDYGDVAILCRASGSFQAYEDALERAGVPFLTVAGRGFYGRPEIRDLLNALTALADPTDDLALVGLLRSPAFALSDTALYALSLTWPKEKPLWNSLLQGNHDLAGDQGQRLQRAVAIITDLNKQAGRSTIAELLGAFLNATDYRAALIQAGETRGARNVAKLVTDAHVSGLVGVGEFLEYVSGLRDSGTREGEARATSEGAVQIMSVHAAKGLEFALVAIGDITRYRQKRTEIQIQPDLGVLLPLKDEDTLPAIYQMAQAQDSDQPDHRTHSWSPWSTHCWNRALSPADSGPEG
jgi:ATP-dependent helicase/nuclease subunit A